MHVRANSTKILHNFVQVVNEFLLRRLLQTVHFENVEKNVENARGDETQTYYLTIINAGSNGKFKVFA